MDLPPDLDSSRIVFLIALFFFLTTSFSIPQYFYNFSRAGVYRQPRLVYRRSIRQTATVSFFVCVFFLLKMYGLLNFATLIALAIFIGVCLKFYF